MTDGLAVRDTAEQEFLSRLSRLRAMLADVETVVDARVGADLSASLRTWAERAHLGLDSVNEAVRVMLEYERKGGLLLRVPRDRGRGAGRPRKSPPSSEEISG